MKAGLLILLFLVCFFVEAKKKSQIRYAVFNDTNFKTKGPNVIKVKVDDWFIIQLNSNPTIGYGWKLENYNKLKKLSTNSTEGSGYYVPHRVDEGITGVGGVECYYFNAKKKGKQKLKLNYTRPWGDNPTLSYDVLVKVSK